MGQKLLEMGRKVEELRETKEALRDQLHTSTNTMHERSSVGSYLSANNYLDTRQRVKVN